MDHSRVDLDSPDYNRGSKVDNSWMRMSLQKDSHCGSKVDHNGWLNPRGSQVDTKGWFSNHKGSKLDYCGSQVHNTWTKKSQCGSKMDHNRVNSPHNNRGSKVDNGWMRDSSQKDSHCGSKVDRNG